MHVEMMAPDVLIPYSRNPRHNDQAVDAVAASLREFGFRQPIVVDERMVVIVGHTRLKAALRLGLQKVPVHVARGLTDEQARAYRLADNRTGELAQWDQPMLDAELDALLNSDVDLAALGLLEQTGNDDSSVDEIELVDLTQPIRAEFWISVRGPLVHQALALQRLQELMAELPVDVRLGTITTDAAKQ